MTHAHALPEQILAYAAGLEEGAPLTAKALLHLGNRAAVDQALARLTRQGLLMRISRGVYVRPTESRFGKRAPAVEKVVQGLSRTFGEILVRNGAAAANELGLTTQVPVRQIYWTSGPSRRLELGKQKVELRHVPGSLLVAANRPAGEAVRALNWLGRGQAKRALTLMGRTLSREERQELLSLRNSMPGWMAQSVSETLAHA